MVDLYTTPAETDKPIPSNATMFCSFYVDFSIFHSELGLRAKRLTFNYFAYWIRSEDALMTSIVMLAAPRATSLVRGLRDLVAKVAA